MTAQFYYPFGGPIDLAFIGDFDNDGVDEGQSLPSYFGHGHTPIRP